MQLKMSIPEIEALMTDEFPRAAKIYEIVSIGTMEAKVRLVPDENDLRPGGTVSGPSIFGLADCAVYYAILAMIGPKALAVTTNASIDFMRKPAAGLDLIAEVTLLKLGRVLAVGNVLIRSEGLEEPVARATLTYSIPPDR